MDDKDENLNEKYNVLWQHETGVEEKLNIYFCEQEICDA